MRTKLLVGGVLLSVGFAMLAPDADGGWRRRARWGYGYGGNACCGTAATTYGTAWGFQGSYAPAMAYTPQTVYGAQTACAVPTDHQGYAPAGGAGTYGSAGVYPDHGQGVQQTGGFQSAPPPPQEFDNERDNDRDNDR